MSRHETTKKRFTFSIYIILSLILTLCFPNVITREIARNDWKCSLCAATMSPIIKRLKMENVSNSETIHLLQTGCTLLKIQSASVCHGAIKNMQNEIMTMVKRMDMDGKTFCSIIPFFQMKCFVEDNPWEAIQWTININSKTPKLSSKPTGPNKSYKILHLSDMHIDLEYAPGLPANCNEPLCCRKSSKVDYNLVSQSRLKRQTLKFTPKTNKKHLKTNYWITPEVGACDIPLHFINATFKHLSKNFANVDFIYWTGDLPPHNVWQYGDHDQHHQLMILLGQLFKQHFPNKPVYYAIGNHENIPVNSFPIDDSSRLLYSLMADSLQDNAKLDKTSLQNFKNAGIFASTIQSGFKIISLNTNMCNNQNFWLMDKKLIVDPQGTLKFLRDELEKAEKNLEKVHILGHIAPGENECVRQWSAAYNKVVQRFLGSVITGQFFGHAHTDEFELLFDSNQNANGVIWKTPSLTTFHTNLPAFRVWETDKNSFVKDFETFIIDEYKDESVDPSWKLEYKGSDIYGDGFGPENIYKFVKEAYVDDEKFVKFYKFVHKAGKINVKICKTRACKKKFLCPFLISSSFTACVLE